jgi:hypothetical protein
LRHGRPCAFIVSLLMALVTLLATCMAPSTVVEALPNPIPVLTLQLTPTQLEAHVTQTTNGAVMFGGNATVEAAFGFMTVTVTLSASCIWPAILSPSTMEFKSAMPQPFYVTVVVPPRTSALEVGQLIVSGTAKAPGMPVATATANAVVTVGQYYMFGLGTPNDTISGAWPGGEVAGRLTINNTGNGLDTFRIALNDPKDVVALYSGRTTIDISGDSSGSVDFRLTISSSVTYGTGDYIGISLTVTSVEAENAGIALSQTIPFLLAFGRPSTPGPDGPDVPDGNETAVPDGDSGGGGGEAATAVTVVAAVVLVVAVVVLSTRRRGRAPAEAVEVPVEVEPAHVRA